MDRQLLERLIGAGVLVIALVLIVPAVLDGEGEDKRVPGIEPAVPATNDELRRTHTIRLDRSPQSPPVARAVPQPEAATRETADTASSRDPDKPVSTSTAGSAPAPVPAKPTAGPSGKPPSKSARAPVSPPADNASATAGGWAVQLGSFSSRQNAQQLADEVGARGYPVYLMTIDRSGKKLYRVRVGPRESRAQAAELAERLRKAGYPGQVTQ